MDDKYNDKISSASLGNSRRILLSYDVAGKMDSPQPFVLLNAKYRKETERDKLEISAWMT